MGIDLKSTASIILPVTPTPKNRLHQARRPMRTNHRKAREAPSFTAGRDRRWARRAQCPRAQQYPRSAQALKGRGSCIGGSSNLQVGEDVHGHVRRGGKTFPVGRMLSGHLLYLPIRF